MDPLRLLSRSTRLQKPVKNSAKGHGATPSEQRTALPPSRPNPPSESLGASRKRKRTSVRSGLDEEEQESLNFFGDSRKQPQAVDKSPRLEDLEEARSDASENGDVVAVELGNHDQEATRRLFKEHKLKATWINPFTAQNASSGKVSAKSKKKEQKQIYPRPLMRFRNLNKLYGMSPRMQYNIYDQGYDVTTEVQLAALPLLLENPRNFLPESFSEDADAIDLLTVAPTGSGKTLAFLIPTFAKIARLRRTDQASAKHTTAIVLAPTKELVTQIVNEGRKLSASTGIKISQARKGMQLERSSQNGDAPAKKPEDDAVKVNVLVSTPGTLHSIIESEKDEEVSVLPAVQMLVLDEADVLLDPLFREQTLGVWKGLIHPQLRVSLWSATMGSNIEELARSVRSERHEHIAGTGEPETPLIRLVVGLKDSAVPNVQHKLVYAATEQGKLMGLRQLLHPATNSLDSGPTLRPPFLVFTQTIERAVALHSELLYDIPAEAGGINRIAVLHSDLSDTARDSVMTRFRKGEIWVLITTDLLSRGVDFRGVNGVVNYDIPTSSAAYVHRVGRTGRAGREGGVAVTLYSKDDIPYLKHIANIVTAAQKQRGAAANGEGVQQWLLDALPSLSKNEKQKFKKHGVEARTARGAAKDPKGAKKARISTKSGYLRREENKRKGAILGSQRRARASPTREMEGEKEFGGFD